MQCLDCVRLSTAHRSSGKQNNRLCGPLANPTRVDVSYCRVVHHLKNNLIVQALSLRLVVFVICVVQCGPDVCEWTVKSSVVAGVNMLSAIVTR